jgi:hypothetical protein
LNRNRVAVFGSALALAMLTAAGCGGSGDRPELGEVTGTVTLDGQPLKGVIVMFTPDSGRPASGVTDESGRYELIYRYGVSGAKAGPNTVSFEYPTGDSGPPIPAKYGGQSTLKKHVESGDNAFDFELSSKG